MWYFRRVFPYVAKTPFKVDLCEDVKCQYQGSYLE